MGKSSSVLAPRPDRLRVGPEIGRGAYGTVYSGTLGGRSVAVKKVHQLLIDYASESEEALEALLEGFRRECELLKAAKHANVVEFLGVFYLDGIDLLVMELMEQTLEKFLKEKRGNLSQEKQMCICLQVVSGLLFLHQHDPQILHRDLTTMNVLMTKNGSIAKISDFGQAKFRPTSVQYLTTRLPGNLLYMPPEAYTVGKAHFTDKGDIFSLGVLMLQVATQNPPSCGLVIREGQAEVERRAADLSRLPANHPLRPLILQCLQDNPAKRPSCNEVLRYLLLVSETPSSLSPPTGPVPTSAQPKEEGATSTEWQSAYEDSIRKHGSVSVGVIQSIFVGPSASGKSTVKHLLVHNEPKEVKTSTAALETPEVVTKRSAMDFSSEQYAVQEGTSAWQPVSSDIMKNSLHHCIAGKEYEEKNQYPIEVEAKEAEDVQREASIMKQAQSDPIALLGQYPIEEGQHKAKERDPLPKQAQSNLSSLDQGYSQVREGMGGEEEKIKLKNASFIHLLDTGGQPSYQDVLPLLLDVPCTYIQVFNASHSLSERIPVTYRPNDHTVVSLGDAECGRDMMLRSFSSMHTMAQKYSKELATFQQKDSPPPQLRIFVVGTHKDELIAQGRLDEATKEIKTFLETLKGKPYYNSIQWDSKGQKYFLVNALSVNDRAYVNNLRERISSEGFLKLDVPLMWFVCQEVTRCTPRKFFRLQDLAAFCRKHHFVDGENAASQFRALLQLLTLLGFYAFFDLEDVPDEANFVCTDRGMFLREVSTLLAVQFNDAEGAEMESFKETGILVFTQKCFKQLGICQEMDAQWFLKALQHLGIAAQLHSNSEDCNDCQEYFIPAALPQSLPTQDLVASVSPLCLTYKIKAGTTSSYTHMPEGVFCRLAVELIRQGWKICRNVKSTRTLLAFNCREFTIFLKESSGYISLIPQVVEEISTIPELQTQCVCLLATVRDGLSLSAKAVLGSNFGSVAELAVGFECPCKEVAMDHLAVPSQTGKSLECLEKDSKQDFSNKQRIWFSSLAGVHGVELVKDTELRIWVIGERPPEPHPKPQPPQPSPRHPVPREGDGALCQEVTAEDVLDFFRESFIRSTDANTVLFELRHRKIISGGDLTEIKRNPDPKQQNEILHRCLTRSCDEEALMEVCDLMIAVDGNRRMNALGRKMKCKLEGN